MTDILRGITQALEPDHGFPLRLVVPGQIGGELIPPLLLWNPARDL